MTDEFLESSAKKKLLNLKIKKNTPLSIQAILRLFLNILKD